VRALSRAEVREVDRRAIEEYGMSGLVLMENAGRGCADVLCALGCRGPVSVVCGRGNNAGDGFVIARHLDLRGIPVRIISLSEAKDLRGDAAVNYAIIEKSAIEIVDCSSQFDASRFKNSLGDSEWIVDAILGTGASGALRPPWNEAIRVLNGIQAKRLAVDLSSGLDCDTGEPADPTFRADHTCTFVAEKIGFANPAARAYLGKIHVLDIGAPRRLLEQIAGGR
jgi:NAD(P)H-hydrate epimerase